MTSPTSRPNPTGSPSADALNDTSGDASLQLEPVPEGLELARGGADLDAAAAQLRALPQPRAVEVADRVLARALAEPRRATMVRARAPYDYLWVSSLAIAAVLREHLDSHLTGAAVGRVVLDVAHGGQLEGLTIELYVQYGTDILATSDQTRTLAYEALAGALGATDPGVGDGLVVSLSHVHVSDVTVGDPHLVDPADE